MNKRISAILICLMIALIFWLLIALSHEYPATLSFPVSYVNLPGKKVVMNELPTSISLRLKTTGFRILSYEFERKKPPIEIDVSSILETEINSYRDVIAFPTEIFTGDFHRQLGNQVNILGYQPDSIVFYLSDRIRRKVPVKLNMSISFEKQFDTIGRTIIEPDSLSVSGPPSIINKLQYLTTERLVLTGIKSTVKKNVAIIPSELISTDVNSVSVVIAVEKITEGRVDVPIHMVNVPLGFSLKTFPEKVTVRYQVALSKYHDVNESGFDAVADAKMLSDQHPEKLTVQLMTYPYYVRSVSIEPQKVDYILRKQ